MKRFRAIAAGIVCCAFVSGLVASHMLPRQYVVAASTGEYPWADALLINGSTYDWGYTKCHFEMQKANTCNYHTTRKNDQLYHQSDPWRYDVRNCTSYVAWRINKEFAVSLFAWGDAHNWDTAAMRAGYSVDDKPRVGDIALWEGYYGHVAYVSEVNTDGSVNIEQYNRAGTGEYSRESRVRATKYIHIAPPVTQTNQPVVSKTVKNNTKVPLPTAASRQSPLPSTTTADYSVVREPQTSRVVVYEVRFDLTTTNRVEVSISNYDDGNTTWHQTWATPEFVHRHNEMNYSFADYNADGLLDMYQFKFANSTSGQTEVRVFDGSKQFSELFGSWRTSEQASIAANTQYGVADHNGDGSLDIFKITQVETKQRIIVLDGAKHFSEPLDTWEVEIQSSEHMNIALGDDDRDGKIDLLTQVIDAEGKIESRILPAKDGFKNVTRRWKEEPNSQ